MVERRKVVEGKEEEGGGEGGVGATRPQEVGTVVRAKRRRREGRSGWNAHFLPAPPPLAA